MKVLIILLIGLAGCKTLTPKERLANAKFFCAIDTTSRWNYRENRCKKIPRTVCKPNGYGSVTCTHY